MPPAAHPSTADAPGLRERSALGLYDSLRIAYGARIRALRPQPGSDLAAALLALACDAFDGNVHIQCEGQPPLACAKGCASCCTLRVTASAPELLVITRFLRATRLAYAQVGIDLIARLRDADAATHGLSETERVSLRQRCAFIIHGACAIYSVRPLACRGHASHDVRACVDAAAGRREDVPFSGPHRLVRSLVQSALLAALDDAGLPWGLAELNEGLMTLLDAAHDPDLQWREGIDPLAGAALRGSDRAQWREVLDELTTLAR